MAFDDPLWQQNIDYAARLDRGLIEAFGAEGVITGLKVTQRSSGANLSVDIGVGSCIVAGDDQAYQGSYFCRNTSTVNKTVNAAPSTNSRIDIICVQVLDTQAGGVTAVGDLPAQIKYVAGTAAATPSAPTVPASCYKIAEIRVAAGQSSVTNANITDKRSLARPTVVVSATQPSDPVDGLIWLKPQ